MIFEDVAFYRVATGVLILTGPQSRVVVQAGPTPVCHDTPGYLVITRERDGEPGTDFIIRRKATPTTKASCAYAVRVGDYVLGKGESADFVAMKQRFLALDAGSGHMQVCVRDDMGSIWYSRTDASAPRQQRPGNREAR